MRPHAKIETDEDGIDIVLYVDSCCYDYHCEYLTPEEAMALAGQLHGMAQAALAIKQSPKSEREPT